jgi:hypothetical protein
VDASISKSIQQDNMNFVGAIVAGIAGTVAMSLVIKMAPAMGMLNTLAPPAKAGVDIVGMLGSMFSLEGNRTLGWAMHMMTLAPPPGQVWGRSLPLPTRRSGALAWAGPIPAAERCSACFTG